VLRSMFGRESERLPFGKKESPRGEEGRARARDSGIFSLARVDVSLKDKEGVDQKKGGRASRC